MRRQDRCNTVREKLPRAVKLDGAVVDRGPGKKLTVKVTAAYENAGLNEQSEDRRPVRGASVEYGGDTATTNDNGIAVVNPRGKPGTAGPTIRISAGDTFAPATISAP